MSVFLAVLLFAIGILFIVKGGDFFIDAASWIAEASGIPKFIIGATVVSFATTLPELIVSVIAALDNKVDMAIGNAVGSVTANVGLIMGISIVCLPSIIKRKDIMFKGLLMTFSCALLFAFSSKGYLGQIGSIVLLVLFVLFVIENIQESKKVLKQEAEEKEVYSKKVIIANIIKFIIGAAGIVIGAQLLVNYGSEIARLLKVPESIIGVTIIAIGTSLPELVTTIVAISKKQSSLSIGNIIGANVIDLTVILPICSLLSGSSLPIGRQSIALDMPICLFIIAIGIMPTIISGKFRRLQGVLMLGIYAAYIGILCSGVYV